MITSLCESVVGTATPSRVKICEMYRGIAESHIDKRKTIALTRVNIESRSSDGGKSTAAFCMPILRTYKVWYGFS